MVRRVATRSQRRTEKKQAFFLLALVLVVALGSFLLGMLVGRSSSRPVEVPLAAQPARLPVAPPESAVPAVEATGDRSRAENLTFYDSLPKGGQAPLGSGINLPPAKSQTPAAVAAVEPARPETPVPAATVEPVKSTAGITGTEAPPPAKPIVASPPVVRPSPAVSTGAGDYLVQAASFRRSDDAKALQARLAQKGYSAFAEEANLGDKGVWYRVYVGPFASTAAADAAVARLKAEEKLSGMVRKR